MIAKDAVRFFSVSRLLIPNELVGATGFEPVTPCAQVEALSGRLSPLPKS